MSIEEIKALIAAKIAGQGNQVDSGSALSTILNEILDKLDGGGGIPDAPVDGNIYGRKDADWSPIESGGDFALIFDNSASGNDAISKAQFNEAKVAVEAGKKVIFKQPNATFYSVGINYDGKIVFANNFSNSYTAIIVRDYQEEGYMETIPFVTPGDIASVSYNGAGFDSLATGASFTYQEFLDACGESPDALQNAGAGIGAVKLQDATGGEERLVVKSYKKTVGDTQNVTVIVAETSENKYTFTMTQVLDPYSQTYTLEKESL